MQNMEDKTALGLSSNLGAMICYIGNFICSFGLIYSIIVVITDKTNKFVRFHAFQSILVSVLGAVIGVVGGIISAVGGIIDTQIGFPIFTILLGIIMLIFGLVLLGMFIWAAIKAYGGTTYKIPIIGNLAEKWA